MNEATMVEGTKAPVYELILIIDTKLNEEATNACIAKYKALIEAEGSIIVTDEWGKRRLAYPINDKNEGYYVYMEFTAPQTLPRELDRVLKISEDVMRFIIIRKEEHAKAKAAAKA